MHRSFKNITIVSNRMQFDERGCLVAFKGQISLFYFYIFIILANTMVRI
jgi:Pyrimidine 5'-nucleotidase (UMPH-1)